jgi:hypothetical protein
LPPVSSLQSPSTHLNCFCMHRSGTGPFPHSITAFCFWFHTQQSCTRHFSKSIFGERREESARIIFVRVVPEEGRRRTHDEKVLAVGTNTEEDVECLARNQGARRKVLYTSGRRSAKVMDERAEAFGQDGRCCHTCFLIVFGSFQSLRMAGEGLVLERAKEDRRTARTNGDLVGFLEESARPTCASMI